MSLSLECGPTQALGGGMGLICCLGDWLSAGSMIVTDTFYAI